MLHTYETFFVTPFSKLVLFCISLKKKVVGWKPIKDKAVISCNLLLNSFPEKESYAMSNTIPLPWHRGSHSFSISSAVEEPITLLQDSTAEGFCQPSNEMIAIWAKHANIKSDQTKEFWKHRVRVSFPPKDSIKIWPR